MKDELLNMLTNYRPNNEDIKLDVYDGYSLIHIDIKYEETPALYTTIDLTDKNKPLVCKICSYDKICSESTKDVLIINELENVCKMIGVKEIYGRAKILQDKDISKEFYNNLGYKFDFRPKDKSYLSAIISKEL
jgi:hypothetical protein